MRSRSVLVAVALVAGACSGGDHEATTTLPPDLDPAATVAELLEAIVEGRFETTAALTVPGHAGLLTLAEGANAADILEAADADSAAVTANFWSGFAQTLEEGLDVGTLEYSTGEPQTVNGIDFVTVTVAGEGREPQYFVVADRDGWVVDLMATFGPVLADRLVPPIDSLLESANADAGVVLARLAETEPSLNYAFSRPDLPADAHQSLLALVERVTRTG